MVYLNFYNIEGSTNEVKLGPFTSVICDGHEVTAVFEDETEQAVANFDETAEAWHVYECSGCPLFYTYFEVYRR